jgi:hypothetical protein
MKRILSLLTVILLATNQYLHAQEATEKIVVLPFRVATTGLKESTQDGFQQLKAYELEQGLMFQKAFYNSLTEQGRHISLEDITTTNARLKAAGIELAKAYWMDKAVLCKLLKADFVITGMIQDAIVSSRAKIDSDLGGNNFSSDKNEKRVLTLQLYDNASGQVLWNFKEAGPIDNLLEEDHQSIRRNLARKMYISIGRYVETL